MINNVLICGTGRCAVDYCKIMEGHVNIVGFFSEEKKNVEYLNGFRVYDYLDKLPILYTPVIVKDEMFAAQLYSSLHKCNIQECYLVTYMDIVNFLKKENVEYFLDESNYQVRDVSKPILSYAEYHVADTCNLNCDGCTHFSPLASSPNFVTPEKVRTDMELLTGRFQVGRMHILGGEPLLNPELDKVLYECRRLLPNTEIVVATNGLLLAKMPETFIKSFKENGIIVKISVYKPTIKMMDAIVDVLEKHEIKFVLGNGTRKFYKKDVIERFHLCLSDKSNHNPLLSSSNCYGKWCRYYRDGVLSKCAYPQLIYILNEASEFKFKVNNSNFYEIQKIHNEIEAWAAIDVLNRETDFCKYCVECEKQLHEFDWRCMKNKNDFSNYVIVE